MVKLPTLLNEKAGTGIIPRGSGLDNGGSMEETTTTFTLT